jgi:hypothetical protein
MTSNNFNLSGARTRPKQVRGNLNRVAFLAVLDDVRVQLVAGNAIKTVWKTMHEAQRISMSYEVFLHYVQRLIGHPQTDQASASTRTGTAIAKNTRSDGTTRAPAAPTAIPGFTFNPIPDIEELF